MPVSFDSLTKDAKYERKNLAELWGYAGFQAISRGVVTPAGTRFIILFVTENKQESLTQYKDRLDGRYLHWEGEARHGSDRRIVDAFSSNDSIQLFHREMHHSLFTYKGELQLEQHNLLTDEPSQVIFELVHSDVAREPPSIYEVETDIPVAGLTPTERRALIKSRIGQGVYRDGLLRLWGGCAVTDYRRPSMLLASHIKPWRDCTNAERLDPYNGLLLQPTIDRLFDKGLVSFDRDGKLIRADQLTVDELESLGIDPNGKLRLLRDVTSQYLTYHREHEFNRPASTVESEYFKHSSINQRATITGRVRKL